MASLLAPTPSPLLPRSGASGAASGGAGTAPVAGSGAGAGSGAASNASLSVHAGGAVSARQTADFSLNAQGAQGARGAVPAGMAAGAPSAADTAVASAADSATVLRAGGDLPISRQPGQQQRLGRLQQGLDYLDRLASSVQQVKSGLSDTLARRTSPSESLTQQVEQLRQLWSQRPEAAAGRVDAQLQAAESPDASARQRFKLRGLDLAVLHQPGRETLRLQLPGQAVPQGEGTSAKPVQLAVTLQGEGTQEQLQVLAKALAPAGLEVVVQGQDLIFQMAEAQWPALRDGLTVRGEGKRFPSGQPVRALLEPAPEALQPQRWNLQDVKGQREALGQLLQAEPRLAQARQTLGQQLVQQTGQQAAQTAQTAAQQAAQQGSLQARQALGQPLGQPLGPRALQPSGPSAPAARPTVTNAEEAKDLVGDITSTMQSLDFQALGALLPAVQGLHRQRVQQLLTPR